MTQPRVPAATLASARARDPDAIAAIYRAYSPDLYRFFMGAVHDKETAEDLVAGVFLGVVESLPGFRGAPGALGGWLFRIARHDLYDHRRRLARRPVEPLGQHPELPLAADLTDPQEEAVARVEAGRLLAAVRTLPPAQREVLLLRVVGGLPVRQVAALVGRTPGAVKALQHRALAGLTQILAPVGVGTAGRPTFEATSERTRAPSWGGSRHG